MNQFPVVEAGAAANQGFFSLLMAIFGPKSCPANICDIFFSP
jgi:hypothetical protein